MTATVVATEAPPSPAPARPRAARRPAPATWALVGCLMLAASGAARLYQDARLEDEAPSAALPPFPLKDIGRDLGTWTVASGDQQLDPRVAKVAGCTDHLVRSYVDKRTGVTVDALILYGPARLVMPHTPELCYPATGYERLDGPSGHEIAAAGVDGRAGFRALVFGKKVGGVAPRLEEVYYAYRVNGRWTPEVPTSRVWSRRTHSVYKVQVQRHTLPAEQRDMQNPTEDFLAPLLADIERRIAESSAPASPAVAAR